MPPAATYERRDPRYPTSMPLRWHAGDEHWRTGITRDLSLGGLFIVTPSVPRPGTPVTVELNGAGGVVVLPTVVRWARSEDGPGSPRGMGVAIGAMDPAATQAYSALVDNCAGVVVTALASVRPAEQPAPGPAAPPRGRLAAAGVGLLLVGLTAGWLLRGLVG